jgi:adenylylsulfate kinase-like enzyme
MTRDALMVAPGDPGAQRPFGARGGMEGEQLPMVRNLVRRLEKEAILYCHWKSNEHLKAALCGDTDLDMLFEEGKQARIVELLREAGFARFRSIWFRRYPAVEDFIGIDPEKGKVVHVHAHFQLVLGERLVKSYRLPWEDELLRTRVWDQEHGIYRSDATWEMLLLVVREAIKLTGGARGTPNARMRSSPSGWGRVWEPRHAGQHSSARSGANREMTWLKERVSLQDLRQLAVTHCGPHVCPAIDRLHQEGLSSSALEELRRLILPGFQRYRRLSPWQAAGTCLIRKLSDPLSRGLRTTILPTLPVQRTAWGDGLIIAILGADGSGKSTVATEVTRELSRKVAVLRLYLGSGNGSSSILRWPLHVVSRCLSRSRGNRRRQAGQQADVPEERPAGALRRVLGDTFHLTWALVLAWEKRTKLKRAGRARRKGILVVCDRFPQADIGGYNDGPLLGHLSESRLPFLRLLANWERSSYTRTALYPPDLVLRLLGPVEVLGRRRPEMDPARIHQKQEGIRAVRFPGCTSVVDLDAGQPLAEVVARAMSAIGSMIARNADRDAQRRCGHGRSGSGVNRPLIIEFAGLPGAGKTTIVDRIIEMEHQENLGVLSFRHLSHLEYRENRAAQRLRRVTGAAGLLVKRPGMMWHLLRYALWAKPFVLSRMRHVWDFVALAQQLDCRRADVPREHRAELLDHGFVQTLGSLSVPRAAAGSANLGLLVADALADWVDGLVWVECSPETALSRVRRRVGGGSRFDRWPDEVFRQNQRTMLQVLGDAVQRVGRAGVPVLAISSADPPGVNAVKVRAWLQSVLSSFPQPQEMADSA